jgi:methylated-DNA-[protein]-cysteine S-methyltransferase
MESAVSFADIYTAYISSPVGYVEIKASEDAITSVLLTENLEHESSHPPKTLKDCARQLGEYFKGKRKEFTVPVEQKGTPFQQSVWKELVNIPLGKTISYMQLAKKLGNPKSIRAVGTANGCNNVCIIVPCHRVIGSDGSLTGYGGGLWRKKWLLEHESKMIGISQLF